MKRTLCKVELIVRDEVKSIKTGRASRLTPLWKSAEITKTLTLQPKI